MGERYCLVITLQSQKIRYIIMKKPTKNKAIITEQKENINQFSRTRNAGLESDSTLLQEHQNLRGLIHDRG